MIMAVIAPAVHEGVSEDVTSAVPTELTPPARERPFRGLADYDSRDRLSVARVAQEVASAELFVMDARQLLEAAD